jgi:hypothetical protein
LTALVLSLLLTLVPALAQKRRPSSRSAKRTRTSAASRRPGANSSNKPSQPSTSRPAPSAQRANTTTTPASTAQPKPSGADAARERAEDGYTFDTLLPSDTFALYGEVRMVGQQMQPGGLLELLRPFWSMKDAPEQLKQVADFVEAHAETLATSRLFFAGMSFDPTQPQGLVALELPSEEAAQKFTPQLRDFLTSVVPPKNVPDEALAGTPLNANSSDPPRRRVARLSAERRRSSASALPFHVKRAGSLIVLSETELKLKTLRPDATKLLSNQPAFKLARSRFSGESLFVYFDFDLMQRAMKRTREAAEQRAMQGANTDEITSTVETASMTPEEVAALQNEAETESANTEAEVAPSPSVEAVLSGEASQDAAAVGALGAEESEALDAEEHGREEATLEAGPPVAEILLSSLFYSRGMDDKWPQAIGFAANMEGDSLAVRALLLSAPDAKGSVVPFFPILTFSAPLAHEASALMPGDTDIFASTSLDLPQMYERMMGLAVEREKEIEESMPPPPAEFAGAGGANPGNVPPPVPQPQATPDAKEDGVDSRLAALEKLLGFKIKEDLIGSLGSEVAFNVPSAWFMGSSARSSAPVSSRSTETIVLISLKDKEKLQRILPRLLVALGLKKLDDLAKGSKTTNGVEILTFSQGAFAFIGNFLAYSPNAASMQRLVDAYSKGQTLAASEEFRASTRWQPKQSLGQVYISHTFLKSVFADARRAAEEATDAESRSLLLPLSLEPGSVSHVVSDEGDGALHEVRLPRNLLAMFVAHERIDAKQAPIRNNENHAIDALMHLNEVETDYKEGKGRGAYATLEQLVAAKQMPDFYLNNPGYKIELSISGDRFEATATPTAYPEKGRRSFFIDQSGVLRAADKGGRPADSSDEPLK